MLDLLHEHLRVVQEADHVIETFGDAQDVCAELGTVHVFATDTSEQGSRLRKTFKDSARQCCSCENNYFSEVFRLQNTNKKLSYRKESVRLLHNIEIRILH